MLQTPRSWPTWWPCWMNATTMVWNWSCCLWMRASPATEMIPWRSDYGHGPWGSFVYCYDYVLVQWNPLRQQKNFLLLGQLSVLTLISVSIPPPVTTVACKRSWSFCQKCRWQVTAKHTYTLCMWLCMKWHGAWLYGVHRMCWDGSSFMWHQPCQCCKCTTSEDIQKCAIQN